MKAETRASIKLGFMAGIAIAAISALFDYMGSIIDFDGPAKERACEEAGYEWMNGRCLDVTVVEIGA